jgi:hypothetical protein
MSITGDSPFVRQLAVADLPAMAALREAVSAKLPVGFIRPKTESEMRGYLDGTRGVAYGIVDGDALLAISLLRIPDEKHPNAGVPLPLVPAKDWSVWTCFLENTMVLPAARGRGYHRILLHARLAHAASAQMRWICAGVHLQNSVSWANLLCKGMAIAGIRFDLGYPIIGLLSSFDALALASDLSDQISIRLHDPYQHQAALQAGYIGVRLASDGAVIYQRLLSRGVRRATSIKESPEILNRLRLRERALFICQKTSDRVGSDHEEISCGNPIHEIGEVDMGYAPNGAA